MYQIKVPSSVRKDIRRLSHPTQQSLASHLETLAKNPTAGQPLKGILEGYRRYAFSCEGTEYRTAYQLLSTEKVIGLVMVASRENFYTSLKKRTRS